jgi:internalin A
MTPDDAYREAERRIGNARQSKAEVLDLGELGLGDLPESLGRLTQLQTLSLNGNQLTALPEWLGQLTQLQGLSLHDNQLTSLPESLGKLTQLQGLSLHDNQLTVLPEWLGRLTQLQGLSLDGNRLTSLPESLGKLTQLQELSLDGNQLTALPESLGKLSQLHRLYLDGHQLTSLPEWLGQLTQLLGLYLDGNQLTSLPECLGRLTQLHRLSLAGNQLTSLPEWLGQLTQLHRLYLDGNQLTSLPESLGRLTQLRRLSLDGNPLNPDLAAAFAQGIKVGQRYLRELAKGRKNRYEAKLLILGDGNEGKTCVSRALRGLRFSQQRTTHGVDVEQWEFAHPDDANDSAKRITLNIWDFEGQEISHQTHQFFLSSQSLYLLVFKCRDQFLMDRAEYWLDTIRARAPRAKVALVITQCEERTPHVPLDRLQAQYGDILADRWFFTVGCQNRLNIGNLQTFLQRWAADLEFMGDAWPASYQKAETRIKALSPKQAAREPKKATTARVKKKKTTPPAHITRDELHKIFKKAGVEAGGYEDAAAAMSRLGVITQFPDCPDLRDFIILRPQWLTKAISQIMEDGQLYEHKGEIELSRMEKLWNGAGYRGMFATFHNCMKEFELCYDLEHGTQSCLVPLRFGYVPPEIPWSANASTKVRRVEYKLNIRPPMGIMSRFIVKTHHMIVTTKEHPKGIYWHNGVFLRTGEGPLASEALCEFVPDERILRIEVRAPYPQNLTEQIHAYVKAVFSFFQGLQAERSYGCIKVDEKTQVETQCKGIHTEKRIYSALSKERVLDCEFEGHDIDPQKLIWGISSFNEFVAEKLVPMDHLLVGMRAELDKPPAWAVPYLTGIDSVLDWVSVNSAKMDQLLIAQSHLSVEFRQEAELKLHEYLRLTSEMLDARDEATAPALFSITTKNRSAWNPANYFKQTYVLTPYCESPNNIHACIDGRVEFKKNRAWWAKTAPWIARGTKLLAAGLQLSFAGMPLVVSSDAVAAIKDEIKFMEALGKHLDLTPPKSDKVADLLDETLAAWNKDLRSPDPESRLMRAALARLLEEIAPTNFHAGQWGSLRRVRMPDNSYRWLCNECVAKSR